MLESDIPNPDANLWVKFETRPVKNNFRSDQAGHPCFDEVLFISIISPGDATSKIERPAKEDDKQRFQKQWLNYQAGNPDKIDGTPIIEWPQITRSQAEELKYQGVHSVEQLVAASDAQIQKINGGVSLQVKAKAFLAIAKNTAEGQRLAAENKYLHDEIASLKQQMAQLGKAAHAEIPKRGPGRPPKTIKDAAQAA